MKEEADAEINGHPGQVKQRYRSASRKKAADLVKIPQRLHTVAVAAGFQRKTNQRIEYSQPKPFVEVAANPRAYSISDQIQAALKGVEHRRKEQERDQRRYATSRQHPIVNLKHEERAGEHQKVAQATERRQSPEYPAARR